MSASHLAFMKASNTNIYLAESAIIFRFHKQTNLLRDCDSNLLLDEY